MSDIGELPFRFEIGCFQGFDLINWRRELNFTEMDMRVKGTGLGVEVIEKDKLVYLNSKCLSAQYLIKKKFSVPTRLLQRVVQIRI